MNTRSAGLEDTINSFLYSKTGQNIYLDLSKENVVILYPFFKRSAVAIGSFWVQVFKHDNNYPVSKNTYRAERKYELCLDVDGVMVRFNLATGVLSIKGSHAIDWFADRMPGVIAGYLAPAGENTIEQRGLMSQELLQSFQVEKSKIYSKLIGEWPAAALREESKLMEAGRGLDERHMEPVSLDGFLMGEDLESYSPFSDLMKEEEAKEQINKLKDGQIVKGVVLYRLWKSLLNVWFSDEESTVFIVTPEVDWQRLAELFLYFLRHKRTAKVDIVCLPLRIGNRYFAEIKNRALQKFPSRDQVFLEYKLLNHVTYPKTGFSLNFIAVQKNEKVYVLQSSGTFCRKTFLSIEPTSVVFQEIDKGVFHNQYIKPLLSES